MIHQIPALMLAIFVHSEARAECSDAEKRQLEALDRTWGDSTMAGNRGYLVRLFADDFSAINDLAVVTKSAVVDSAVAQAGRARANPATAPRNTYHDYVIACTPNTATITHRASTTRTIDGKEQTTYSRAIHVLEKRDRRWQVVSSTAHLLSDEAVLTGIQNDWTNAYLKRDITWFERNIAADGFEVSSTGALLNRAQMLDAVRNDKSVYEQPQLSDYNVRIDGNTAIARGVNHVRGRDEKGQALDMRVRFTDVFIKRDGRWLIVSTQGTRLP